MEEAKLVDVTKNAFDGRMYQEMNRIVDKFVIERSREQEGGRAFALEEGSPGVYI